MYSESNKEINSYRYLNFAIQPTYKKILVSSSLRLPRECSNSGGFWVLLSLTESRATICPLQQKFSCC